jgi:hypothetical protein
VSHGSSLSSLVDCSAPCNFFTPHRAVASQFCIAQLQRMMEYSRLPYRKAPSFALKNRWIRNSKRLLHSDHNRWSNRGLGPDR